MLTLLALSESARGQDSGPEEPGPVHKLLKAFEGSWEGTLTFPATPGEPELKAKVEEVDTLGLNGLWLRTRLKGTLPDGKAFEGESLMGFDLLKKKVTCCAVDDQRSDLQLSEGSFDVSGKILTLWANLPHRTTGKIERVKMVDEVTDPNTRRLTQYTIDGNKEVLSATTEYKRKP
jgi:hypothetical protein